MICLKPFYQGNKPYPQDRKADLTKTEVKKGELVPTLKDDTKTKKGCLKQMADTKDTTKKEPPTLSKRKKRTLMSSAYSNAANPTSGRHNLILREWCCSDSSFFGMPSVDSRGCTVTRLTMREDMTTYYGYRYAQSAVNNAPETTPYFCGLPSPVRADLLGRT